MEILTNPGKAMICSEHNISHGQGPKTWCNMKTSFSALSKATEFIRDLCTVRLPDVSRKVPGTPALVTQANRLSIFLLSQASHNRLKAAPSAVGHQMS